MAHIQEVLNLYRTNAESQDGRQMKSVMKKAGLANGFQKWESAPVEKIDRQIFKDYMTKKGMAESSRKVYLHFFDEFMTLAKANGAKTSLHIKTAVDPVLKKKWAAIEKASNNRVIIQKFAGYSTARKKEPRELNQNFFEKFCTDCTVNHSTLAKHWNRLIKKGVVKEKFIPIPRNVCFHAIKFKDIGVNSKTVQTEWKKISKELGSKVSMNRSSQCTGAGKVTQNNRKNTIQYLLWWYLHVKVSPQQREKLLKHGGLTLSKLLQVHKPKSTRIQEFIRYGEEKGIALSSLDSHLANLSAILHYYHVPAKPLSIMRSQLKKQFDIYDTPQRYEDKIEQVSLENIHGMIMGLKVQRQNAKEDIEKAKLCRDELLIGLLAFHLLRRSTISKLRDSGKSRSFKCFDANDTAKKWFLILTPDDHKSGKKSKTFELNDFLVEPHENWKNKYRAILMNGKDHTSYLVRNSGEPFKVTDVYKHAIRITVMMLGIAINPHLFRHLVATKLIEKDERYLISVSKMLLHRSIDFTAKKYLKYDEKTASRRINGSWKELS